MVVIVVVFKVFSQYRVQQRFLLPANAFLSGLWSRSLTFFLVLALDRDLPLLLVPQKRILLWFFALFLMEKKCGVPGRSVRTCPGTSAH